jgi:hypothetical protein
MKKIKSYTPATIKEWKENETRIFNILTRSLSYDELYDLCQFRGILVKEDNQKSSMAKAFMVGMGNILTNKHFSSLK